MSDNTSTGLAEQATEGSSPCSKPFKLCELVVGKKDKLGHVVEEFLWIGRNYAIYRSQKGVYVHFSDSPDEEKAQRSRFAVISPEMCELRHLTYEMDSNRSLRFRRRTKRHPSSLYHHNMAQALMLVIEEKVNEGREIARQALAMAVQRVTNDNTISYYASCLIAWLAAIAVGGVLFLIQLVYRSEELEIFLVAAMSGATGAVLSVAFRLQAFQLKPCHQSDMNSWMSVTRVGIGVVAGPILLLLASTILKDEMSKIFNIEEWRQVAVLGLIAGFSERLIPIVFQRTIGQIEPQSGTPVQAARSEARQSGVGR